MSAWLPDVNKLKADPELLAYAMQRYKRVLDGDGYGFWEWDMVNDTYISGGRIWENLGYTAETISLLTKADGFYLVTFFRNHYMAFLGVIRRTFRLVIARYSCSAESWIFLSHGHQIFFSLSRKRSFLI